MKIFKKGEIVWAKMTGYPYYPALVKYIYYKHRKCRNSSEIYEESPTVEVEFYGDHSRGGIDKKNIEKFVDFYKEYSQSKKPGLIKAISEARSEFLDKNKNLSSNELYNILGKKRLRKRRQRGEGRKDTKNKKSNKEENPKKPKKDKSGADKLDKSFNYINDNGRNVNVSIKSISIESEDDNEDTALRNEKDESERAVRKIRSLTEDLIRCKVEVRRRSI